jgi:hypothetical protein
MAAPWAGVLLAPGQIHNLGAMSHAVKQTTETRTRKGTLSMIEFDTTEDLYLPNGSYFYNVTSRCLHAGNFVNGTLTPPPGAEMSPLTFNLVPTQYMPGYEIDTNPVQYLDVLRFPTLITGNHLMNLIVAAIPPEWSVKPTLASKFINPHRPTDAPVFEVTDTVGGSALLEAREIAFDAVEHSDDWAINDIKLALKTAGLPVA